ncbi:hypothetical protein ACN2CC_02075 [Mesorhizobium muleiense]|uniref:hypothetical protein n=1 Tax=Mesorhizobium muleiense TaxID=1004279 RepID=UPI003AFACF1E
MTERLFIGALGPEDRVQWGKAVAGQTVVPDDQLRVVSPVDSQNKFLELWCTNRDGELVIVPLQDQTRDALPKSYVEALETVLLAPIGDGSPIPSAGFLLVNPQHAPLRLYGTLKPEPDWPDWHFELAMRGIALFRGVAPGNKVPAAVTRIILGDPVGQPPADSTKLWLNPLVLSLRDGVAIPGLDGEASDVHLKQAVSRAVAERQWMLVPRLSIGARRRLVGWQAFFAGARHSLLRALFFAETPATPERPQLQPAPLQDLAALDDIGGTFHNPADDVRSWRWEPPAADVGKAEAQLRRTLLDSLDLAEKADPSPNRFSWNRSLSVGRDLDSLDIPAKASLEERLNGAAQLPGNSRAQRATLEALSIAVEELARKLPIDATEIFSPLPTEGAFFEPDGKVTVSLHTALQTIAKHYFAPRSPVAVSLLGPRTSAGDEAQLREKYTRRSIDLFVASGGEAVETLLTVLDGGGAAAETVWGSRWETAFWRHCITGDGATRFVLTPGRDGFVLDQSLLDGPDLLMENAR